VGQVHTQRGEKALFRNLLNKDFKDREWLLHVVNTGKEFVSDLFFSKYAHNLIITIAEPIHDEEGKVTGVVDFDFKFEELTKLITPLPDDLALGKSDYETRKEE
jgi:hypothetical protein